MILALSRFRVANGMQDAVRDAFEHRPGYVDDALGFLGMETFVDVSDPACFYLATRWADRASFEAWHHSKAHHHSHRMIPKGLRLDAAETRLCVLERIADPSHDGERAVRDSAALAARFLRASEGALLMEVSADLTIRTCEGAAEAVFQVPPETMVGTAVRQWLMPGEDLLGAVETAVPGGVFPLRGRAADGTVAALRCHGRTVPGGVVLYLEVRRAEQAPG